MRKIVCVSTDTETYEKLRKILKDEGLPLSTFFNLQAEKVILQNELREVKNCGRISNSG
jgi:antitoxin component of RelBE/YafQ-DinJ toxin-antitoxin module